MDADWELFLRITFHYRPLALWGLVRISVSILLCCLGFYSNWEPALDRLAELLDLAAGRTRTDREPGPPPADS